MAAEARWFGSTAQSDKLVATTNARLIEMRGRHMTGWLRVGPHDLCTKQQLAKWVRLGQRTPARSPEMLERV